LPENSNLTVSRRQPFVLMMQATDHQINLLRSSDIIYHAIDSSLIFTDAIFDATYNRTLYGSNVVISVDIPTSTFIISLNNIINNRVTH
ncbi:MAG: hypothetical protein ABF297_08255, partial [Thiogranum sp.]